MKIFQTHFFIVAGDVFAWNFTGFNIAPVLSLHNQNNKNT
jgi:hypothetical protein